MTHWFAIKKISDVILLINPVLTKPLKVFTPQKDSFKQCDL